MSEYKIVVPRNPYVRQALAYLAESVCPDEAEYWEQTSEPDPEMVKAYKQIAVAINALGLDDEQSDGSTGELEDARDDGQDERRGARDEGQE